MPFIIQDRRELIDTEGIQVLSTIQPGDRCYVFYKDMVEWWKSDPSWTTAHTIYKDVVAVLADTEYRKHWSDDERVAYSLAWQVFFQLYVMPYELKKREENGDI